jgi:hypothetical protein
MTYICDSCTASKGGYTSVTLLHTVTPNHDSADGTCNNITYQKLVMR